MPPPLKLEDYKNLANKKGFVFTLNKLPEKHTSIKPIKGWLCIFCDIIINVSYKQMKGFTNGCKKCFKPSSKKKTLNDYKNVGKDMNISWDENIHIPKDSTVFTNGFICQNGHRLNVRYKDIRDGTGCKKCSPACKKELIDYQNLAKSFNSEYILDIIPENTTTKCINAWKCRKGHIASATYHSIEQSTYGCSSCAGNKQKTVDDYKNLAIEKGFEFISNEIPKNIDIKITDGWLCNGDNESKKKHKFTRSYHEINQDAGCDFCNKWKSQDECIKIFEELLGIKFQQNKSPKFLGGKLQLDGYNEKYNIAIEYNGEHHYKWIKFFHTKQQFTNQTYNDRIKEQLCEINETILFIVPYKYNYRNKKAMKKFIENLIEENSDELLDRFEEINNK